MEQTDRTWKRSHHGGDWWRGFGPHLRAEVIRMPVPSHLIKTLWRLPSLEVMSALPWGRWKRCFANAKLPSIPLILGTISLFFFWQQNPQCIPLDVSECSLLPKEDLGLLTCWTFEKHGKMCSNPTIQIILWDGRVLCNLQTHSWGVDFKFHLLVELLILGWFKREKSARHPHVVWVLEHEVKLPCV